MPDDSPWPRLRSEIYAFIGRNPKSNRTVVAVADPQPDDIALDIGCGPGAAVRKAAMTAQRAVGVDRSAPMIEIAARRSRYLASVQFTVAGAEALPFPDDTFTLAWTIHAFHHWEDPAAGIGEVFRVLRSGGRFLIAETETNGNHGITRDGADELAERLQSAGFGASSVVKHGKHLIVTAVC